MLGVTLAARDAGGCEDGVRNARAREDEAREESREWLSCRYPDDSSTMLTLLGATLGLLDLDAGSKRRSSLTALLAALVTLCEREGWRFRILLGTSETDKGGCCTDIVLEATLLTLGAQ